MPSYFDPTRRVAPTPAPVVVKSVPVPLPPSGYFDPSKPRAVRSKWPGDAELRAAFDRLEPGDLRTLEQIAALPWNSIKGETAFGLFLRRVGSLPRCETCGAIGRGEYGHRQSCSVFREWRYRFENPWFFRERAEPEEWDDNDLPF